MLKRISREFAAGYRWPDDWNRHCHTLGYYKACIPSEWGGARVRRGLYWAAMEALCAVSDAIHPDGPR